jgi:hypothetical protein
MPVPVSEFSLQHLQILPPVFNHVDLYFDAILSCSHPRPFHLYIQAFGIIYSSILSTLSFLCKACLSISILSDRYTCVCIHACMYLCMYVCMYACMHIYMYVWVCVCTYVRVYVCVCMYVCRYVRTYLWIYTYCVHVCISYRKLIVSLVME